jgi:plasmid stability protein
MFLAASCFKEIQLMSILINLSPELETQLRAKAAQQGQDISSIAAEILASALAWETQDTEDAIEGIQQGLNDFEIGKSRSFDDFAAEQRHKYNLPDNT